MIISRQYIESDLGRIKVREADRLHADVSGYLQLAGISTVTQTLQNAENLEVVGIVGLNLLWTGVAQVWMVASDAARGHGLSFTKAAKRLMLYHAGQHDVRRIHIVVNAGLPENIRWARALGFRYEGTMYGAAPDGNDMEIYVYWTKGVNHGGRRTVSTAA